jgi:predicted HicB family RNase H-like nuclease
MAQSEWSSTMMNLMTIDGYKAVIQYDPEIEMFRGQFVGLNGGADFYAADVEGLSREGHISLKIFLEQCERKGIAPRKEYSGKFNVRISPKIHEDLVIAATAHGKSLNQWVAETLERENS